MSIMPKKVDLSGKNYDIIVKILRKIHFKDYIKIGWQIKEYKKVFGK